MIDLFTPKVPGQPDADSYGVEALQMLPRLNRAIYAENVGSQATIWNLDLKIKRWADLTVKDKPTTSEYRYLHLVSDGKNAIVQENVITVGEAISVNLPGKYSWAKWKPAPVMGYVLAPLNGLRTPISENFVSTRLQAEEMKRELDAAQIIEQTFTGPFRIIYEKEEDRRLFLVRLRGTAGKPGILTSVGLLLRMKYRQGVGAPGKWESPATEPRWIPKKSDAPGEYDARPEVPIPIRALLSNETPKLGFAGIITIFKDKSDGGGGSDDEILQRIDKTTAQILRQVSSTTHN
jgi:hypothetical protein